MSKRIGFQAYSIKEHIEDEQGLASSFRKLAAAGYDCVGASGTNSPIPPEIYARIAKENGIEVCGTHSPFEDLIADPQKAMEWHRILGCKNIGIGGNFKMKTEDDVKEFIKEANDFAATIAKEGFKFTYHNHCREYIRFGDKTMMDMLREGLDPATTSFVLDTYWVQAGGGDVRHEMEKLAGRVDILHLKDMHMKDDWSFESTEVGNGNLWWDGILPIAEQIGVKYYVVEQEAFSMDPFDSLAISAKYIHSKLD